MRIKEVRRCLAQIMNSYKMPAPMGMMLCLKGHAGKIVGYFWTFLCIQCYVGILPTIARNPLANVMMWSDEIWCDLGADWQLRPGKSSQQHCSSMDQTMWLQYTVPEISTKHLRRIMQSVSEKLPAMNCQPGKGYPSSIETLQKLTGLRIPTIKNVSTLSKRWFHEVLSEMDLNSHLPLLPENIFF